MFLGYLVHDHRCIERDDEGTLGAFCEKGDVGCEYSILQWANPVLVDDVHSVCVAIKRDARIKISLNYHTTKGPNAFPRGLRAPTGKFSIRIPVDCRNFVESLSVNCRSEF